MVASRVPSTDPIEKLGMNTHGAIARCDPGRDSADALLAPPGRANEHAQSVLDRVLDDLAAGGRMAHVDGDVGPQHLAECAPRTQFSDELEVVGLPHEP